MQSIVQVEELAYRVYERIWTPWALRRYRDHFDQVGAFCLFVGYPRSGHSVVGALLNAHSHAVIAHELNAQQLILDGCSRDQLYARIVTRANWFALRGNASNYTYQVPRQWQGRFEALHVIGDKRGGAVTRCVAAHPDFLDRTRALVRVPLKLIHVVRNPFDNISAISIWNGLSLSDSVDFYFRHCDTTARLDALCPSSELLTLHHEDIVRDPRAAVLALCAHVGLAPAPAYVNDCASVVFPTPSHTRRRVAWPAALVQQVEHRAVQYPFLREYGFAVTEAGSR